MNYVFLMCTLMFSNDKWYSHTVNFSENKCSEMLSESTASKLERQMKCDTQCKMLTANDSDKRSFHSFLYAEISTGTHS